MAAEPIRRRFTLLEYHAMGETGIFAAGDRTELIDGEVWEMTPIGSRHAGAVKRTLATFARRFTSAQLSVQDPVVLSERTELQPDLALLAPRDDFYAEAHPRSDEVLLVVEVADSTLGFDRGVKARLYARAGIAELWIVDLAGRAVEVHRDPRPDGYASVARCAAGEPLAPLAFPEIALEPDELFGP